MRVKRIADILEDTRHRPWDLPVEAWRYYQEWNHAVFLHWRVSLEELRKFVPHNLSIDLFDSEPWVSLVAFTMEQIRPRYVPAFPPISNFHEINIRTYVKYKGRAGVYFLSIEGGTSISCLIAKGLSGLPYRFSRMMRGNDFYRSSNVAQGDCFEIEFGLGDRLPEKNELDRWLTERYGLFHDEGTTISDFDIHHLEWPIYRINVKQLQVKYPRFDKLLGRSPDLTHYSTGVQVVAWDKKSNK